MVDDTGIEPVTPTMSMWCSTAEPIVLGTSFVKSITSPTSAHFRVTAVEVGTGRPDRLTPLNRATPVYL